jgi:hypothetical protein
MKIESYNERFDSKAGTFTRGFRGTPSTARVELTQAERDTLWDLLAKSGFFEAPSRVGKGSAPGTGPGFTIRIDVLAGSARHTVDWNPTLPELNVELNRMRRRREMRAADPQEKGLFEFLIRLDAMEKRRDSVRALPRLIHF